MNKVKTENLNRDHRDQLLSYFLAKKAGESKGPPPKPASIFGQSVLNAARDFLLGQVRHGYIHDAICEATQLLEQCYDECVWDDAVAVSFYMDDEIEGSLFSSITDCLALMGDELQSYSDDHAVNAISAQAVAYLSNYLRVFALNDVKSHIRSLWSELSKELGCGRLDFLDANIMFSLQIHNYLEEELLWGLSRTICDAEVGADPIDGSHQIFGGFHVQQSQPVADQVGVVNHG